VPRNIAQGTNLLMPWARAGDGEAAAANAWALQDLQPRTAYSAALLGGQAGAEGMAGLLDRLEKRLGLITAMELQAEGASGNAASAPTSLAAIRSEAAMHASGNGRARSYAQAAQWAMLGAAAGDAESADILAEIEERMRLGGDVALAAWSIVETQAATAAAALWIDQDLPARLSE